MRPARPPRARLGLLLLALCGAAGGSGEPPAAGTGFPSGPEGLCGAGRAAVGLAGVGGRFPLPGRSQAWGRSHPRPPEARERDALCSAPCPSIDCIDCLLRSRPTWRCPAERPRPPRPGAGAFQEPDASPRHFAVFSCLSHRSSVSTRAVCVLP